MKSNRFVTILKGGLYAAFLLLFTVSCLKDEDTPPVMPTANFSFSPTNPEVGQVVTFTNESTDATSYLWTAPGTSFSSTQQSPTFTFDTAGDYEVTLVATNADGEDEITKMITVSEAPVVPVANFSFSPANPEVGQVVSFTNESTDAISYQWSAAGTSFSSTDENPTFTFDTAGDYDVTLIATNTDGTNQITKTITVSEAPAQPIANFSYTPNTPQVGQVVSFTNESTDATSYQWSAAGTSFSSTEENPTFTFDAVGDYEVTLVATNANGSDEITKSITVSEVPVVPVANFSFSPANPEVGQVVTFTNESTDATSYQWSAAGTSFSSTEENPTFTFDTAGDYDVTLVATNTNGSDQITKTITVSDANSGGGNNNPCNLPECYVTSTTTNASGATITVTYDYTMVNGIKKMSSITTASAAGNTVTTIQYDAQGRRIYDETRLQGVLQNSIDYEYSNGDQTVRANTYDANGTLTSYSISEYDANMRLTSTHNYTSTGNLTSYTIYSNFLNIEGSFPQLVETYDANDNITQTDEHTYQDCQLIHTVSRDGNGTLIGEVSNTLDANNLLRTSNATIYIQGFSITSTTNYVYDCD